MIRTIEQLREEASRIEEATRQGENTQLRVGGLFQDIIDFIGEIPITQTILGPLLTALNNSQLIDPSDGQTLTFSIMDEGWTFSDALTQLQLRTGQISSTVTSNYEAFLQYKDLFQQEIDATDQRVRSYKTDYDNSQIEYATWKSQTDTSIAQFAAAFTVEGELVSMSEIVQTAHDITQSVTNNKRAADAAFEKLFNLTGLDYTDPDESYTASWIYQNRQGIYGAAATFDNDGNILSSSVLGITVAGIESRVGTVEGNYSAIVQTYNSISATVNTMTGKVAGLEVWVSGSGVEKDGNGYITNAKLSADKIDFHFTQATNFYSGNTEVMNINAAGDLTIKGKFQGELFNCAVTSTLTVGSTYYDYIIFFGGAIQGNNSGTMNYSLLTSNSGGLLYLYENTSNPSVVALLKPTELNLNNNSSIISISTIDSSLISLPRITLTSNGTSASISLSSNGELIIRGSFPTSSPGVGIVYEDNGVLKIN